MFPYIRITTTLGPTRKGAIICYSVDPRTSRRLRVDGETAICKPDLTASLAGPERGRYCGNPGPITRVMTDSHRVGHRETLAFRPSGSRLVPFRASIVNAVALAWTGQLEEACTHLAETRNRCVERGNENDLMAVTCLMSLVEVWRGDLAEAAHLADEAMERAEQGGGTLAAALTTRAMVAAYLGREHDARADVQAALDLARRRESPRLMEWPLKTPGFLEVSRGNYAEAVSALQPPLREFKANAGTDIVSAFFLPDAIEGLVSLGRHAEAEPLIDALERNGRRNDRAWMLAVGARCRSMSLAARGDVDAAERMARQALVEHDRIPMRFARVPSSCSVTEASSTPKRHCHRDVETGACCLRGHRNSAVGRPRPRRTRAHQSRPGPRRAHPL